MSKKIIGVTVGTPISPSKLQQKLNPVKTVNGKSPDANGNVEVTANAGYTPAKGIDYWTPEDKKEITAEANELIAEKLEELNTLPYGGSKEWLDANGDRSKLYQIGGYVWAYIVSNGWTKSNTQFLVVSSQSQMTNVGGIQYLLRSGNEGRIYSYTKGGGDKGIPVYASKPTTANEGDVIAVGGRKYRASLSTKEVADYTDLTKQDGWTWVADKRLNSSGTLTDAAGTYSTDYIQCKVDDIIRIKGLKINQTSTQANQAAVHYYNSSKGLGSVGSSTSVQLESNGHMVSEGASQWKVTAGYYAGTALSYTAFGRFCGILYDGYTINDVIITVNEEIKNKTVSTVTWTDIGEYIPPAEAGWNATDETYSVIDNLSSTANSGASAVYSGDGYVYTYIAGADWMATSKYNPSTVDNALSESSINAVQNKVVAVSINEVKITSSINSERILALQNKVEGLDVGASETVTIPSYWESEVAEKTEIIKDLQTEGGKNCVCFAWASDTHIPDNDNGRTTDLGKVMAKMLDNCEVPFALLTGDINTRLSYATEDELIEKQASMPVHLAPLWGTDKLLMALGNHDGAYGDSSCYYRKQYPPEKMWSVFFRGQALDFRRVFSDDGLYFYVDNIPQKTRFVVLNSQFCGEYSENASGVAVNNRFSTSCYGQAQLDWLAKVALDMPEGYSAIISAHAPPNITYTVDKAQLIGIINAYCNKTTYSGSYTAGVNGWTNNSVSVDFRGAKGNIIAFFAGHVHWDKIDTTTMVCPIITIISAGASVNAQHMLEGEVAPTRTVGTATETSFDVVTINKATRTIYCTRVGAGSDRVIGY